MTTNTTVAVMRDASGYRTHRLTDAATRRIVPSYHVSHDEGRTTACGRIGAEFTAVDLAEVSDGRRCRRPGCRQGWSS